MGTTMISRNLVHALFAATLIAGCGGPEDHAPKAAKPRVVQARVGTATLVKTAAYHPTPATLVAENQVQVASRLMGYLRAIHVVEGQGVGVGQKLFSVDPVDVEGQVEQARAFNRTVVDFYDRVTGRADPLRAVPNPQPAA